MLEGERIGHAIRDLSIHDPQRGEVQHDDLGDVELDFLGGGGVEARGERQERERGDARRTNEMRNGGGMTMCAPKEKEASSVPPPPRLPPPPPPPLKSDEEDCNKNWRRKQLTLSLSLPPYPLLQSRRHGPHAPHA